MRKLRKSFSLIGLVTALLFVGCNAGPGETADSPESTPPEQSAAGLVLDAGVASYTLTDATLDGLRCEAADFTLTLAGDSVLNGELRALGNLTLNGAGRLTINSGAADCINADGDIIVNDGLFTLSSAEGAAIHSEANLTVSGGVINVQQSYEGLEAEMVSVTAGEINVVSSDDGINAAVADADADAETDRDPALAIRISGGLIRLYTESDGLDSNGSVDITGGTVIVYLNNASDGDPIDADGPTALTPTLFGLRNPLPAGTELTVRDAAGEVVFTDTLSGALTSFSLTLPALRADEDYTAAADGVEFLTAAPRTTAQAMGPGGGANWNQGPPGGDRPLPDGERQPEGERPPMPEGDRPFPEGERPLPDGERRPPNRPGDLPEGDAQPSASALIR
ncbi:MAG: carbohydrate-binding domain-containing protein [Gracilibacteraceae bacterium]|jgi:hypothetical protein|nr:carbohydrate-binding domain-containing protein [Gracilibacteraceae bacterium]